MIKTTCDVCGAAAENTLTIVMKLGISSNHTDTFDLCPDCTQIERERMLKSFNDHHNKGK